MAPKAASSENPCIVETSLTSWWPGTVRGRNTLSCFGLVHACICGKSFPPLIPVGFLPDMRKALSRRCGKSPNTTGMDCISLGTSGSSISRLARLEGVTCHPRGFVYTRRTNRTQAHPRTPPPTAHRLGRSWPFCRLIRWRPATTRRWSRNP